VASSWFKFRNKLSSDYKIKVIKKDLLFPPKRERKIMIPSRHGKYDFGSKYFDERVIELRCILEEKITRAELRGIAAWLSKKGDIILWDEPDKRYTGEVLDTNFFETMPTEVLREWTLLFVAEPFAKGDFKIIDIKSGDNEIEYGGTIETPTKIVLVNNSKQNISNLRIRITRKLLD